MRKLFALLMVLTMLLPAAASASTLTADADVTTIEMSDTLYGLFFEDINYGADGGLYAELLRNRSFEYEDILNPQRHQHLNGWISCCAPGGRCSPGHRVSKCPATAF